MNEIVEAERAREAERCPVYDSLRLDRGEALGETKLKEYLACRDRKTLLAWG